MKRIYFLFCLYAQFVVISQSFCTQRFVGQPARSIVVVTTGSAVVSALSAVGIWLYNRAQARKVSGCGAGVPGMSNGPDRWLQCGSSDLYRLYDTDMRLMCGNDVYVGVGSASPIQCGTAEVMPDVPSVQRCQSERKVIRYGFNRSSDHIDGEVVRGIADTKKIKKGENDAERYKKLVVQNMEEFFQLPFGQDIAPSIERVGKGKYKVIKKIRKYGLKKGMIIYLDLKHKDHIEVFKSVGAVEMVLNLDGTLNLKKTQDAIGQGRTIDVN